MSCRSRSQPNAAIKDVRYDANGFPMPTNRHAVVGLVGTLVQVVPVDERGKVAIKTTHGDVIAVIPTHDRDLEYPALSIDRERGRVLVTTPRDGLYVVDLTTRAVTRLTRDLYRYATPTW